MAIFAVLQFTSGYLFAIVFCFSRTFFWLLVDDFTTKKLITINCQSHDGNRRRLCHAVQLRPYFVFKDICFWKTMWASFWWLCVSQKERKNPEINVRCVACATPNGRLRSKRPEIPILTASARTNSWYPDDADAGDANISTRTRASECVHTSARTVTRHAFARKKNRIATVANRADSLFTCFALKMVIWRLETSIYVTNWEKNVRKIPRCDILTRASIKYL